MPSSDSLTGTRGCAVPQSGCCEGGPHALVVNHRRSPSRRNQGDVACASGRPSGACPRQPAELPRDIVGLLGGRWLEAKDGDPRGLWLYERHYSARRYKDGRRRRLFVGPGEKMVLLTTACDALFVWRKFRSRDGQRGVNCAAFRNESDSLSSDLIREACEHAWRRWPGERLYTFVNPAKVRSTNPGCCFKIAGWRRCGQTKGGGGRDRLLVFERLPSSRG
jgi:hypothetical protein